MPLNFLWNSDPVPKGRLKVAQDVVLGSQRKADQSRRDG
jgi:hypothetical protein